MPFHIVLLKQFCVQVKLDYKVKVSGKPPFPLHVNCFDKLFYGLNANGTEELNNMCLVHGQDFIKICIKSLQS